MKIPCACKPAFIIAGFAFLKPELTNIQSRNLTMIATALILGAKFNLTEISRMWLREKSVAALSEFLSDAKFSTIEAQRLHLPNMRRTYKVAGGRLVRSRSVREGIEEYEIGLRRRDQVQSERQGPLHETEADPEGKSLQKPARCGWLDQVFQDRCRQSRMRIRGRHGKR